MHAKSKKQKHSKRHHYGKRNHNEVGKTAEQIAFKALARLKAEGKIRDFGKGLDKNGVDCVLMLDNDRKIPFQVKSSHQYALKHIYIGLERGVIIPLIVVENHNENIKGKRREDKINDTRKKIMELIQITLLENVFYEDKLTKIKTSKVYVPKPEITAPQKPNEAPQTDLQKTNPKLYKPPSMKFIAVSLSNKNPRDALEEFIRERDADKKPHDNT